MFKEPSLRSVHLNKHAEDIMGWLKKQLKKEGCAQFGWTAKGCMNGLPLIC
jgi:hypothetical protein